MQQALATGSATPLLSGLALLSRLFMPALLSCFGLPTPLSSHLLMPTLLSCPGLPTPSSSCLPMSALSFCLLVPVLSSSLMPALLSLPVSALASRSVLSLAPTRLIFSALRTFKQTLLDKPLVSQLTNHSPLEPLCLFPIFSPLPKKSDRKRLFDTTLINSRPLVAYHATKEVYLSFGECE